MIVLADTCAKYIYFTSSFDLKVEAMVFLTTGFTLVIKMN